MGGFEGGDEGGFWDEDAIDALIKKKDTVLTPKNQKKVIIKTKDNAFIIQDDLSISIVPQICTHFTIEGCDTIPLKSNTIYKTYQALLELTSDSDIEDFFLEHKVVVTKYTLKTSTTSFLLLVKELCSLVLNDTDIKTIQEKAL